MASLINHSIWLNDFYVPKTVVFLPWWPAFDTQKVYRHPAIAAMPEQVMRLFSANALYLFHESLPARESHEYIPRASRHTTAEKSTAHKGNGRGGSDDGGRIGGGRDGLGVRRVNRPPVNKLRLDVPELSSDLDSSQVRIGLCPCPELDLLLDAVEIYTETKRVRMLYLHDFRCVGWSIGAVAASNLRRTYGVAACSL